MSSLALTNQPIDLLWLCRPKQWTKNIFVFTGLVFGHKWNDPHLVLSVCKAALAFCCMASAIYILNDIVDREKDRLHPKKSKRPLASGVVTVPAAGTLGVVLAACGLGLAGFVSWVAAVLLLSYATLNIAYSIHLKHVVILDVFCIASGFMIRILVGTVGTGIPPSNWLMLCGLMITLFLGFAKRRAELICLVDGGQHRAVLSDYGRSLLDQIGSVCAAAVIVTYCLYTTSIETIHIHKTPHLILTAPFLIYALFRYLYLVHQESQGGDPSSDLFQDKHIVAATLFWAVTVIALLVNGA